MPAIFTTTESAAPNGRISATATGPVARISAILIVSVAVLLTLVPLEAGAKQSMVGPIAAPADDWFTVSHPGGGSTVNGTNAIRVGGFDSLHSGYDTGHLRFSFVRMPASSVQAATLRLTAAAGAKWPTAGELGIATPGNCGPSPVWWGCATSVVFPDWIQDNVYSIDVTTFVQDLLSGSGSAETVQIEFLLKPGPVPPLIEIAAYESIKAAAPTLEIFYG